MQSEENIKLLLECETILADALKDKIEKSDNQEATYYLEGQLSHKLDQIALLKWILDTESKE